MVATERSEDAVDVGLPVEDMSGDMSIVGIGKVKIERYKEEIENTGTIFWSGTLGLYECNRLSHATKRIAEAVSEASKKGAFSVVGGGDTLDFFQRYDYSLDDYSFVSSGGGAMLEFLSAEKTLPALVPLMTK